MPRWTDEARRKQAAIARRDRPWQQATGPKTLEGKAVCAQNAMKHGLYSAEITALLAAMREQNQLLKIIEARLKGAEF
jgi:hypothetical protein